MSKTETLLLKLEEGWCDVPSLCAEFGWKPHTLRAAISGLPGRRVIRRRVDGITSYRLSEAPEHDGQPTEQQEWQDYDRDC